MKTILIICLMLNLILLLIYYLHMFQLNSYQSKKHLRWIKANKLKVIYNLLFIQPIFLILINHIITYIISIAFLCYSIIHNLPNKKPKVPFRITNRVKRMIITLILIIILLCINSEYILFKLYLLNLLSSLLPALANLINYPIELFGKKHYIAKAKKMLKRTPNLIVIGITGSYGKTSVKNFLEKMLKTNYNVLATPLNYNTPLGIAKTIREHLKPTHEIFICEMGATKKGDIKEICDIVKPKIGIITAIGPQHLESFKTIDNIIKTKFELAKSVKSNNGIMFLNYNNEYIKNYKLNQSHIKYGINDSKLDYNSYNLKSSPHGISFTLSKNSNEINFKSQLIGKHNIINLTSAISVANYLGIPLKKLKYPIQSIKSVEHRLQLIPRGNLTVIDNSYNSNPISSKASLETLAEFKSPKIIITPGLIELGSKTHKYNFEFGQQIAKVCDYIFLVNSKSCNYIKEGIDSIKTNKKNLFNVKTPEQAFKEIYKLNIQKAIVLIENDLPDNYNV